jgi:hypothetical protein
MGSEYSEKYTNYISSPEWAEKKNAVFQQNRFENHGIIRCADCHTKAPKGSWQVHHSGKKGEAYRHLGNEPLNTLRVLCGSCHTEADERRRQGLDDRPPENGFTFDDLEGITEEWIRSTPMTITPPQHNIVSVTTTKEKERDDLGLDNWESIISEIMGQREASKGAELLD